MNKEQFPKSGVFPTPSNENEASLLIDAFIAGKVGSWDKIGTRGKNGETVWLNGRYVKNPIFAQKEKLQFEPIVQIARGSIADIACRIIISKYAEIGVLIDEEVIDEDGEPALDCFNVSVNSDKAEEVVFAILGDSVIVVLEMGVPEVNYTDGIKLEKEGLLKRGTTMRAYVRVLQNTIKNWEGIKPNREESKKLTEYKEELSELKRRGIKPLTKEEITLILEELIDEIVESED